MIDMANQLQLLHDGIKRGWWEAVDDEAMLPVRVFNVSDFHETATLAHAWVRLGKFASVKEAKRAGWGRPLEVGRFRIGTWMMEIRDTTKDV